MSKKYQVSRAGEIIGSFSSDDIAFGLKTGSLSPTDHYWLEGTSDWIPLSELLSEQSKASRQSIAKRTSIAVGLIILFAFTAFGLNKYREKIEGERIAGEEEKKAGVSAKIQYIKMELGKCEAFLKDFEIVGKGSPDKFDKTRPIDPGAYKYNKPLDSQAPPRPDYRDQLLEGKHVPRFDLIINMRGDDKIDLSIWGVTFVPLRKRFPLSGTGTIVQISVDGNVVEIGDVHVNESVSKVKTLYSSYTSIENNLAKLRELITKNKGKPLYVRFTVEGERQITETLHNEEERFQKFFEMADIIEKKKKLTEELSILLRQNR
jgi:hypothetical protein